MRKFEIAFAFLLLSLLTVEAQTELSYSYSSVDGVNTATVIGIQQITADGVVDIPSTVTNEGVEYNVTAIGNGISMLNYAMPKSDLITVNIPATVVSIADNAFDGCTNLKNISFPESLKSVGNYAFRYCAFTNIDLPAGVNFGNGVFENCDKLTSINISDGVTAIGDELFIGCSGLVDVVIPAGVVSIGVGAFSSCIALENIDIPSTVTSIADNAFDGCMSLTDVVVPNGVTSISSGTFHGCYNLANVTIPATVSEISMYSFYGCALKNITIESAAPASLSSSAFDNNVYSSATLYVPVGSKAAYEAADVWSNFKNVVEKDMGSTGIDTVLVEGFIRVYTLDGVLVYDGNLCNCLLPAGIYVVESQNGVEKLVIR